MHPVDDFKATSKPLSTAVLRAMGNHLDSHQFSLKDLVREICNSKIYQVKDVRREEGRWTLRGLVPLRSMQDRRKAFPHALELPKEWIPDSEFESTYWDHRDADWPGYRVPDKEKKALDAFVTIRNGDVKKMKSDLRFWSVRMRAIAHKPEVAIPDNELHGWYGCDQRLTDTIPYRVLAAVVEQGKESWYFRLVGPADTVDDWRQEFAALVKKLSKE